VDTGGRFASLRGRVGPRAVGGWFRASPKTRIGGAAAAVALGVSGLFGGLTAEASPAPHGLEPRTVVHAAPFDITVKKLATIADLDTDTSTGLHPDRPGDRLFVLSLRVRNTSDKPAYALLLRDAFGVRGGGIVPWQGDAYPRGQLVDFEDSTSFSEFSPDVTYDVLVVYEQRAGWTGRDVELSTYGYTYKTDDTLDLFTAEWTDPQLVARGTFPVDVIPESAQ
jgi:hypothetical protein